MHDSLNVVNTDQKLLYDIRQLLIEQNTMLTSILDSNEVKSVKCETIPLIENKALECKWCGLMHDSKGSMMACAKKFKNKGER